MPTASMQRLAGWAAVFSATIGLAAFCLLVAALVAPTPSPATLRRYDELFRWQDAGVLLQALAMIPVTLGLHAAMRPQTLPWRNGAALIGLAAQASLVLVVLLRFAGVTSDMLYMLPQGFVGLWLLVVNWRRTPPLSRGMARTGVFAGLGLLVAGVGFLIYGALVAPRVFLGPLTNAEIDAQSWTIPNVVAHLCLAVGLLGRAGYPVWTLLLGRDLLRRDVAGDPQRGTAAVVETA